MLAGGWLHGEQNAAIIDALHGDPLHMPRHIGRQRRWNGCDIDLACMGRTERGVFIGKQKYQAIEGGGRAVKIGISFNYQLFAFLPLHQLIGARA